MLFSQRQGHTALPEALELDAMPDDLRNSLWNAFDTWRFAQHQSQLMLMLWRDFWKQPVDTIPSRWTPRNGQNYDLAWKVVRDWFFSSDWRGVYDILDFCLSSSADFGALNKPVDAVLARELAAYRVIGKQLVPVTDELEISALKDALADGGPFLPVSQHLATALLHLSNRQDPDYRNSIKESISAVEAVAKIVSGKDKAELGDALAALERTGKLHTALRKGYTALYGYTSDANGIRHALMDEPNLTAADAKYFLLACTSFVNYLKTLT